ncbi:hypothetical protein ACM9W9_19010 [Xanthomonas sacchari]
MPYRKDLKDAARRHFRAAEELHNAAGAGSQPGCRAVAGYLFGISGELCVKAMMSESGIHPPKDSQERGHPYYAHFPELKAKLRDYVQGRRSEHLRRLAESQALFSHWDVKMRYAPTSDIPEERVGKWRQEAKALIDQMEDS